MRRAATAVAGVLGGLIGVTAHRMNSAEYPWSRPGAPAATILDAPEWPAEFPLSAEHLKRIDESPDSDFYREPRFLHHIDGQAQRRLQQYYRETLPKGGAVLDLMSSWVSHLAEGAGAKREDGHFARLSILGMNEAELKANSGAHDYHVRDLNRQPSLEMFADESFDAVFCSVSVDYLSQPVPVFAEIRRVLKPGGLVVFTWSNRMFPTKAITAWRLASEPERLWICGAYVHFCGGFSAAVGEDISPHPGRSDPVYAVHARKLPAPPPSGTQKSEL